MWHVLGGAMMIAVVASGAAAQPAGGPMTPLRPLDPAAPHELVNPWPTAPAAADATPPRGAASPAASVQAAAAQNESRRPAGAVTPSSAKDVASAEDVPAWLPALATADPAPSAVDTAVIALAAPPMGERAFSDAEHQSGDAATLTGTATTQPAAAQTPLGTHLASLGVRHEYRRRSYHGGASWSGDSMPYSAGFGPAPYSNSGN